MLGSAIAHWAYSEEALAHILACLLECSLERAEIILYASNSDRFRSDLIRALAKVYVPDKATRKELTDALNLLGRLAGSRNLYVHGLWKYDSRGRVAVIPTKRGPLDWFSLKQTVSLRKLKKFRSDTSLLRYQLLSALSSLKSALRNKPQKQSRRQRQKNARSP